MALLTPYCARENVKNRSTAKILNPERWTTPEPEIPSLDINWVEAPTPNTSMVAIRPYSDYIDYCLSSAINSTIPISPTVRRVIDKRNKAQNIMTLEGVLSLEELEKKSLEEIRRSRHKWDGEVAGYKLIMV